MIGLDDRSSGSTDERGRDELWQDAVRAVLAKSGKTVEGDVRQRLDRTTVEGLAVPALATPSDDELPPPGVFPYVRGIPGDTGEWDVRSHLCSPQDALAREALEELSGGATSLWVVVGGDGVEPDGLGAALCEVYLDAAPVVVQASGDVTPQAAGSALAAVLRSHGGDVHPRHQLGVDGFRGVLDDGTPDLDAVVESLRTATDLGIRGAVVDGTAVSDAGGGDAQEVGFLLAAGLEYLRAAEAAGLDLATAARAIEFRIAVTDDQLVSIAKLRAARLLWAGVATECGLPESASAMHQHAVTARPMMTRYDPHTNMLRGTVAAFAAGTGGAESVTVLPFDDPVGRPSTLGRRMARNISALLLEESHVGAVADPGGGSHAIEQLTDTIADTAWDELRRIESVGGLTAALADGTLQMRIAGVVAERTKRVRTRRQPITGLSEFPMAGEQPLERERWEQPSPVASWGADFEDLRDAPVSTPVVLATIGSIAQHTARATFVTNLFTAGGVPVVYAGATDGPDDAVRVWRESSSPVVVVTGSDQQYAEHAAAYVSALRAAGATHVLLAGRPADDLAGLVDGHVAVGQDAVEVLERTRSQLQKGAEK